MLLPTECYKDVLSFLSRNDLDIISLVNRQSASVVAKYFASDAKPSRHMHSWVVSKNPGVPYLYPNESRRANAPNILQQDGTIWTRRSVSFHSRISWI
uniref:F-box domain-containing protein n=1 Tax=Ditylenchus dipsaci TaxID=166011 RepID=A0A915CRM8_9BILA